MIVIMYKDRFDVDSIPILLIRSEKEPLLYARQPQKGGRCKKQEKEPLLYARQPQKSGRCKNMK